MIDTFDGYRSNIMSSSSRTADPSIEGTSKDDRSWCTSSEQQCGRNKQAIPYGRDSEIKAVVNAGYGLTIIHECGLFHVEDGWMSRGGRCFRTPR
jgi:hypothetical protein